MTSEEAFKLVEVIARHKFLIRANWLGCDNDLARSAHDIVVDILDAWHESLTDHIGLIRAVEREEDPAKRVDLAYYLRQCDQALERDWYWDESYDVGGRHKVEDGFVSPVTGLPVDVSSGPVTQAICENLLCGLIPLVEKIALECRLAFIPTIVFEPMPTKPVPATPSTEPVSLDDVPF